MELFLTKLLPVFVYPLGLALGLLILGGVLAALGQRRGAAASIWTAVIGLWIAATPAFADWALGSLERQHPPGAIAALPAADVVIALGGAVRGPVPPRVTLELREAADRVLHAARIFRAAKAARVLVTGGNLPWQPGKASEATLIRDLLVEWGVAPEAIVFAGASRNTYENAVEVRAMRERSPFNSALLVTSASHMPRALAVFQRAGLPVTPAATDVAVVTPGPWTILRWLPGAVALEMTTRAMKEWLGYWVYRARGYA